MAICLFSHSPRPPIPLSSLLTHEKAARMIQAALRGYNVRVSSVNVWVQVQQWRRAGRWTQDEQITWNVWRPPSVCCIANRRVRKRWRQPQVLKFSGDGRLIIRLMHVLIRHRLWPYMSIPPPPPPPRKTSRSDPVAIFYEIVYGYSYPLLTGYKHCIIESQLVTVQRKQTVSRRKVTCVCNVFSTQEPDHELRGLYECKQLHWQLLNNLS